MEQLSELFVRGFNHGYLLAQYHPKMTGLLEICLAPLKEYSFGFMLGKFQFELDRRMDIANSISQLRNSGRDRDLERGLE